MTTLHAGPSEVGTHAQHHPAKPESKLRKSYTIYLHERQNSLEICRYRPVHGPSHPRKAPSLDRDLMRLTPQWPGDTVPLGEKGRLIFLSPRLS